MAKTAKRRLWCALAAAGLLAVAAAFVLRFSYSTSFLYPGYCGYDSAIFQTIGKYWAQGTVPYKDLFDHKGPLIFFIDMLGYLIRGRAGILVLQTLNLALSLWLLYKLARLTLSRPLALLAAGTALVYLARTFDEGNLTEEYALPFIALSLWLAARWCLGPARQKAPHPWQYAAVYGACFGAILMLRVTSAVSIGCFVLVICICLIARRQWAALGRNALGFVGGFAAATGPFCVYFALHGALGDMLYGTVLYNVFYATSFSLTGYYGPDLWAAVTFRRIVTEFGAPLFVLAALALVCVALHPREPLGWAGLACAGLNMALLFNNRPYVHYFMIAAPLVTLCFVLAGRLWQGRRTGAAHRGAAALAAALTAFYLCSLALLLPRWPGDSMMARYPRETQDYNNIARSMAAVIPAEERDAVLAWEVDAQWYLAADLKPCRKYFIHQDWQSAADPAMQRRHAQLLADDPPRWLVLGGGASNTQVLEFVQANYTPVSGRAEFGEFGAYTLYRYNG